MRHRPRDRVVAAHGIRTRNFLHVVATDLAVPGLDHALHRAIHPSDPAQLYRLNKGLAHLRASIPALAPLRWANAALWRVALLFERHSDPASLQSDEPTLPLVFPLLGANAGIRILIWPARSSVTPLLLPDESFRNAVTGNTRAFEIATMAGPLPLGGFLVAFADFPVVNLLGAALGCAFLGLLRPVRRLHPPSRAAGQRTSRDVFAGAEFIWRKKVILGASTLDLVAVLLGGGVALLPIYADQILHVGPIGFGWLRAAPSIGAFTMAMWVAHRPALLHRGRALLRSPSSLPPLSSSAFPTGSGSRCSRCSSPARSTTSPSSSAHLSCNGSHPTPCGAG